LAIVIAAYSGSCSTDRRFFAREERIGKGKVAWPRLSASKFNKALSGMHKNTKNKISHILGAMLIVLSSTLYKSCGRELSSSQICEDLRREMEARAAPRSISDIDSVSGTSEGNAYIECQYAVDFRREGRYDSRERIHEGVAAYIYKDPADFTSYWMGALKSPDVQSKEPGLAQMPLKITLDSGPAKREYFMYREQQIRYRIQNGYILLFLKRGDYKKGEFSKEAIRLAESLQNEFSSSEGAENLTPTYGRKP